MIAYQTEADRKKEVIGFKWLCRDGRKWLQNPDRFGVYDGWIHGPNKVAIEWKFRNNNFTDNEDIIIDVQKRNDLLKLKEYFDSVFYIIVSSGFAYYVEINQIKGDNFRKKQMRRPERLNDPDAWSWVYFIPRNRFLFLGHIEGVK